MTVITATYRVVTPMFIGDADQKATSLRPPSIKGALRFWWRALNWGNCRKKAGSVSEALNHLHQEEQRLFGTAAVIEDKKSLGQGVFLLRVSNQPKIIIDNSWPTNNTGSGYLGFGIMESGQSSKKNYQPHREGIREGVDFELELYFKPGTNQTDVDAITETLKIWGLFGGLGSRARRGFGSVTLLKLNGQDTRLDQNAYRAAVKSVLANAVDTNSFPPYTALSRHSRFGILSTSQDARLAHNQAGLLYKAHRGQTSALRGTAKIPFGLPLRLPLQGVDLESRRASPLIFHIHALRDGSFAGAVLYLPAEFHHESRYQTADLENFYREVKRFIPMES
ncbi:MAG: type III-B CRISPR module RAMP protein Cmr1 [Candidatus Competibacteraceae bacterium]|nr:MAG: type III-B CRISPR module RAMP protein Cmr1 [Candidatus Competibacteraceae bacterium]